MVAGAFPIAKLAYLAVKQISKPIAAQIKNGAKHSRIFRNYVCLPPAQFYHWAETTFKMRLLGFGKPVQVAPLNEQMAVELGADMLGEGVVFVIAAATLYVEYARQSRNTKSKEDELQDRLDTLDKKLEYLINRCEQQDLRIQQMDRQINASPLQSLKEKLLPSSSNSSNVDKTSLSSELSKLSSDNSNRTTLIADKKLDDKGDKTKGSSLVDTASFVASMLLGTSGRSNDER